MSEQPEGADAASIELIVAMNRFSDRVDALNRSGTNQTVTLSGGSFGMWAAVTCCIVSFVINVGLAVAFVNHDRKIDDLNDYVNAIYMMAPHLKPAEKKE